MPAVGLLGELPPGTWATPTRTTLSCASSVGAALIGLGVLCGWIFDIGILKSWFSFLQPTRVLTSIVLVISGCAVLAIAHQARVSWRLGQALAVLVLFASLQSLWRLDLGVETSLLGSAVSPAADADPLQMTSMADVTAVCFVLIASGVLLARAQKRVLQAAFVIAVTLALLLVASTVLLFLFRVEVLRAAQPYSDVSLPSTIAQALLTFGLLCVRPDLGWMRSLSGEDPAAREMRSLAIGVVTLLLALAALVQAGLHVGLYPQSHEVPLLVFGSIVISFTALLMMAARLRRIDHERQQSSEARERAESELEIALAAARMVGFQLDLATGVLRRYANAQSNHTSDHAEYLRSIHPADRERVCQYLARKQRAQRRQYELRYRVLDSEQRLAWVLEKGEIRYDKNGTAREIYGVMLDITHDVQMRIALEESEARFRRIAESMPQIVFLAAPSGKVLYINQRWHEYTGTSCVHIKDYRRLMPAEDFENVMKTWRTATARGEAFAAEFRLRGADGHHRWFLARALPVRGVDGRIERWCGTSTDIDAQKRAQEELRLVTDHANVLLAHCDDEMRYLFVNRAYTSHFGLTLADVIGKTIPELAGESAFRKLEPYVRRALSGEAVTFEIEVPIRQLGPRYMHCRYVPDIDSSSGKVRGFVAAITDVTDRRRLEEQLREADRRKDEFLALLAHELRNPLAPIRYAAGLLRPGVPAEISAAAHEVIERQVTHMARLVDDLLDVSRVTRNTLELRNARVDLREIVGTAVDTVRPLFEAVNHTLTMSLPPEPAPVVGDSARMLQIIGNLLNNAAQYTDPGGRIDVSLVRESDHVVLRVRDNGIGIGPDLLPKIFELFVQGDRTQRRASGGLGVGLSLAKRLVELHGGSIAAHSEGLGRGSTFTVKLPAAVEPATVESPALAGNVLPIFQRRHQLLIVDDNLDAANSLAILAQLSGYVTHIANDGLASIEMAEIVRPEAIIMDLGMPRMSGFEAARWVRQQPWGKDTVLIAVTGWGHEEYRRRSREAGFDVHLTKPVDSTELLNHLRQRNIGTAEGTAG